jgi:DNA polymerase-3 subunit delta
VNDDFNLLKDEALNGNKFQTNKLLSETLLETEKNILYLNLINQRLNKLSEIEINAKNSNIEIALNTLKPPIFWKEKAAFLSQARKWNSKKINSILRKTYDLEIQVKSNSLISKSILMKKLLLDICDCANS